MLVQINQVQMTEKVGSNPLGKWVLDRVSGEFELSKKVLKRGYQSHFPAHFF